MMRMTVGAMSSLAAGRALDGMQPPRIAVGPSPNSEAADAIRRGGAVPVTAGEHADGLVWLSPDHAAGAARGTDGRTRYPLDSGRGPGA